MQRIQTSRSPSYCPASLQQTSDGTHSAGGVDNRNIPGAQPLKAAVKTIVDVIEYPTSEAYTSSFIAETIARYRRDPKAFEAVIALRRY